MKWYYRYLWQAVFSILLFSFLYAQNEQNLLINGSFESVGPYRWSAEEGAGAELTWAMDEAHTGLQSLKIEKTGTGQMSRWISDNNVRYWVTEIGSGVDIKVGAWVKTDGVNTNPADEDAKWQLKFWFYDEDGELIGGVPFVLDIDQSVASRDWYADTNGVGTLNLDVAAKELYISAEAGPNATGTVWFDSFIFIGRDGWAGQNWNGFVTATEGWQYWIAPSGGNDGRSYFADFGITDEHAHSGDYSLKLHAPVGRERGEWVWFSETIEIPAGSEGNQYVLSAWVRTEDIIPDSVFNPEYALGFTWTWHTAMFEDGGGWNEVAGADYRFVLTRETTGWTQYQAIMTVPRDDVQAVSVRLRSWHDWTGTAYFDDVEVRPISDDNLVVNNSFESDGPYRWNAEAGKITTFEKIGPYRWNAEEREGAELTWAMDEAHTGLQSLKIEKTGTGQMSRWISDNNVRYWVTEIGSGVDIKVGAWVKTDGVNTNPADEDAKWQLKFWFYDEDGELIGGVPFVLDIDQSVASRDWYADTNGVGTLNLDVAAKELYISAEAGPNATGTVWFDSFIFIGRDGWAGQNWNGFVTATEGWQYWIAPSGGNDGRSYFADFGITGEHAHTGDYSLKLHGPVGRPRGEWVWFSETIEIPAGSEGNQYVLSAWVRTEDIIPDSVFNPEYALGFTWTWHTAMFEDGGGWNEVAGADYRFVLTRETTGWTQYQAIMTVPRDDVQAVSVRLRSWHDWTGTAFFDDVEVRPLVDDNILANGSFESVGPYRWNAEEGAGAELMWAMDESHTGLQSLKIEKTGTGEMSRWISDNNVRYWVTEIGSGVDIKVGAWVKTDGVNTNPADEDAKWQLKFWFYDEDGELIGGVPFVLDIDQSVASRDWYADTNGVGTLNLDVAAKELYISAEAGPNATGTVWFDSFIFIGRDGWAGQNWNGFVTATEGWQYWIAPSGGNDGRSYFADFGITDEHAHSGDYSLKLHAPVGRERGEWVWFSETIEIPAGSEGNQYVLSAWVRTEDIIPDSVFNPEYALGFTWTWHTAMFEDGGGWNEVAGADYRFVLTRETTGWTQYQAIMTVPRDDVQAVSVRLRSWHDWTGTAFFDDVVVQPLEDDVNMLANGSFEEFGPNGANGEDGDRAILTWATDETHTGLQSLKIEKPGAGEMSRWISDNQVRYWVTEIGSGVDIKVGAWVKTEDVNTNPADEDAKWQLKFWFYDEDGELIGGVPFVLDIDQSVASRDWYADTNGVGTLNLDVAAKEMYISAEAGPNATGTVWFDSFIFIGRDGWAGQNWNGFVTATEGWQYWIAPSGGNDGRSYFADFGITGEHAHTGDYSLKLHGPVGRPRGEWVWFSETIEIPAGSEGNQYVLSAWVRTEDIIPDSVFNPEYALGFTWTWHTAMFEDGGGWNEVAGADYRFVLTRETTGWTQYQAIMTVPRDDVQAVSVRLRSWHDWTGTAFFDDVKMVEIMDVTTSVDRDRDGLITDAIPNRYQLLQNYPNPFNPITTIEYHVPETGTVTIEVFNMLGQKVRTLVNEEQHAGQWRVIWDSRDDYGRAVSSGMYIYRFTAGNAIISKKMLLLK